VLPGPQDYRVVPTDLYRKRGTIIPQMSFTQANRNVESELKSQERAKSPGPNTYRVQSAALLKRSPNPTIGNQVREISEDNTKSKRIFSPGPTDYTIKREITNGPKHVFAKKYMTHTEVMPGPTDYDFDPT